jgi:hypothetical protein
MTMRRFSARVAAGCSLLLVVSVMSTGGALAVTPTGVPPQPSKAGVVQSQPLSAPKAPVLTTVDGDHVPPGVDLSKSVSTAAVVNAAKVASYPGRTVSSSRPAPWLLSAKSPAQGLTAATPGVTQLGAVAGSWTSIPAGRSTIPGRVSHVPSACEGTGRDGERVQVLYVRETGTVNRFSAVKASLASFAADVDDVFALSSLKTDSGRRVRWNQDSSCNIAIYPVEVPAGALGTSASPSGALNSMKAALRVKGWEGDSTKHLVFSDTPAVCGIADTFNESQKELNRNDSAQPMYARIDPKCWLTDFNGTSTAAHELMHMLGGINSDAPNAVGSHCSDESDVMCYAEVPGQVLRQVCPVDQEPLYDCNNDDYFNAAADLDPVAYPYLATHWNTADSSYLTSAPVLPASPVVTGPVQIRSGGSAVFTAAHPGISTFQWVVQSAAGCTANPLEGPSTTVSCPVGAVAGSVTVMATGTASDGQLAEGWMQSSVSPSSPPPLPTATIEGPSTLTAEAGAYAVSSSNPVGSVAWTSTSPACVITNPATSTATVKCTNWNGALTLTVEVTDVFGQVVTKTMAVQVTSVALLTASIAGPSTLTAAAATYAVSSSNLVAAVAWTSSSQACVITNPATSTATVQCTNWNGALTLTVKVTDVFGQVVTKTMPVQVTSAPVVVPSQVGFTGKAPTRVLDTRYAVGAPRAKLGAGRTLTLTVPGLPAGTTAVALNVTATDPTVASHLSVYPGGSARPGASSLNFVKGQTIPNLVLVPLGPGNTVTFYNNAGTVNVIADLVGYYG